MRTKIGKRIGPLPIAVAAVFALAALLSVGLLLAPNATPTAEAQDADCTVYVDDESNIEVANEAGDRVDATAAIECSALGDTARIKFVGPVFGTDGDEAPPADATAPKIDLVIPDANGTLSAYMNGHVEYDTTDNRYELTQSGADAAGGSAAAGDAAPAPTKFRLQTVDAPLPARSQTTGTYEAQSITIPVKANVYIYGPGTPLTTAIADGPTSNARRELVTTPDSVMITFLGVPAIGKDGGDLNKKVDDAILEQCESNADDSMKMEGTNDTTCPDDYSADDDAPVDMAESRSKLIVRTGTDGTPMALLNGKSKDHEMNGADDSAATIYAVVEDTKGQALEDVEVTFMVTSVPAGIAASTRTFDSEVPETAVTVAGIVATDAIAMRTVSGLPTGNSSYRVSVKVMAGSLNLGTIVLARAGKATTLDAGIYDYGKCVDKMGTDTDMSDDEFMMSMADCAMVSGPTRFPREGTFVVSAMTKDARGTKTGENWAIKDISKAPLKDVLTVVRSRGDISMEAYLLQVKDDAAYGKKTITLTNSKTGDDMVTQDIVFYVAGPPTKYRVDPMGTHYTTNRRLTFTVSALDENDGVPHFTTKDDAETEGKDERNNRVMIDALYGQIRGVDSDGYITLDADTGKNTFTYTLPRDAAADEEFDIFVGEGDMQQTVVVVFGEAPPDMTFPGKPMNVAAMADGHDTIDVSWDAPDMDGNSRITGYIIERRYEGDMMGDIPSDGYNTAVGGASFAFSDHMEWWETLNCKGMLAAAGSDADHTMDSDDKTMYCAHYDMTKPTNMAGTITTGDTTDMKIKALFDKRYIMDYRTDATATMHSDTGLMAETEYTYRVSAVNAEGRSMWSDADTATTGMVPPAETKAPTGGMVSVLGNSISVIWTPNSAQSTTVVKVALFNEGVSALADVPNNVIAFNVAATDPGAHTFTNVPSGTYKVILAAVDSEGNHVVAIAGTATVN